MAKGSCECCLVFVILVDLNLVEIFMSGTRFFIEFFTVLIILIWFKAFIFLVKGFYCFSIRKTCSKLPIKIIHLYTIHKVYLRILRIDYGSSFLQIAYLEVLALYTNFFVKLVGFTLLFVIL